MMKLFGKAVIWKANKQDLVTTSSIKAELFTILQTAKKIIYLSQLGKSLTLIFSKALLIKYNN